MIFTGKCQFFNSVDSNSPHHFSGSKQLQIYKGCNFSLLRLYLLALLKNGRIHNGGVKNGIPVNIIINHKRHSQELERSFNKQTGRDHGVTELQSIKGKTAIMNSDAAGNGKL